jgi:hypothetical protein
MPLDAVNAVIRPEIDTKQANADAGAHTTEKMQDTQVQQPR